MKKSEPESTPVEQPKISLPCRYMRSKEMYYEEPGQEEDDYASGAYWCMQTEEAFGPDNDPCDKQDCGPHRSCYRR